MQLNGSPDSAGVLYMWVFDLGLALRVCPGMAPSSGADCSAPGVSPCPLPRWRPAYPVSSRGWCGTDCCVRGFLGRPDGGGGEFHGRDIHDTEYY